MFDRRGNVATDDILSIDLVRLEIVKASPSEIGPGFKSALVNLASGFEERNSRRESRPLR